MFTIISFLLSTIGCINWLMIGLFQYDFIAGIFGFQASILSRVFYILFGLASLVLVFKLIKGKGTIAVFSRRNKKNLEKNMEKAGAKLSVEAGEEATGEKNKNFENDRNFEKEERQNRFSDNEEKRNDFDGFDSHYRKWAMLRHLPLFAIFTIVLGSMFAILFFNII